MIYEAKSGSVDGVATCSRNTVGRESNSISVIGIIGPLTGPFLPFSLHVPSRHFVSTFYSGPPFLTGDEREREREEGEKATNGIREVVFPMCSTQDTRSYFPPVARATTILHQIRDPGIPSRWKCTFDEIERLYCPLDSCYDSGLKFLGRNASPILFLLFLSFFSSFLLSRRPCRTKFDFEIRFRKR